MIQVEELAKRYGAVVAVDGLVVRGRAGRDVRAHRPQRRRQDDHAQDAARVSRAPTRDASRSGRDGLRRRTTRARGDALGYVPQRVEFPAGAHGARGARLLRRPARARARPRSGARSSGSASRATRRGARASSRAATRSGSRSRQALLGDPALLVLDEPTASLDPEATWEFRTLVEQLRREGKTILLCSHLLTEVERVADRVLILVDGRAARSSGWRTCASASRASRLRLEIKRASRRGGELVLAPRRRPVRAVGDARAPGGGRERAGPRGARRAARRRRRRALVRDAGPDARGNLPRGGAGRAPRCVTFAWLWPAWLALAALARRSGLRSDRRSASPIGEPCAACGMAIQDPHFACERGGHGRYRQYDSIECLLRDGPARAGEAIYLLGLRRAALRPPIRCGWCRARSRRRWAAASPRSRAAAARDVGARTRGRVGRLSPVPREREAVKAAISSSSLAVLAVGGRARLRDALGRRPLALRRPPRPRPLPRVAVSLDRPRRHVDACGRGCRTAPGSRSRSRTRARDAVELALAGYRTASGSGARAGRDLASGEFIADRPARTSPGWSNGRPVGRLAVAGSHLIEGHR